MEADAAGGLASLEALMDEVSTADPARADIRTAILRAVWADLLPRSYGKGRP